jgi:rhodanese-related sulfurtransferase
MVGKFAPGGSVTTTASQEPFGRTYHRRLGLCASLLRGCPSRAIILVVARIDEKVAEARRGWDRVTPADAHRAHLAGALLVDTRTPAQREVQGDLPGALVIDRTVLEWRLDPTSEFRIPEAVPDMRVIVVCRHGYSSSLAARSLRDLGIAATDVIGGAEAWSAAGLPVAPYAVGEWRDNGSSAQSVVCDGGGRHGRA